MLLILIKVTLLYAVTLLILAFSKRAAAATRHLLCASALAGSLLLPLAALIPAPAAATLALRLPVIDAAAVARTAARSGSWSPWIVLLAIWVLGCAILLTRLAIGHSRVTRLIRSATPLSSNELCLADVAVPVVCGLLRPVVLMPRSSSEWPQWQFDAAVRHEITHIRRNDLWTTQIAHLACAVWWFHPLSWILAFRLRDCQEIACDDAVLFSGFEPTTYAEALLAVAKTSTRSTLLQGCSMTTQTNLKSRIARLLDGGIARATSRTNLLRTGIAFAIVLAGIATVGLQKTKAQSSPGRIYTMADGVNVPKLIYRVEPQYTEEAKAAKISGTEFVTVVVGTDGLAHDISITKGLGYGLDEEAIKAVTLWHFQPGTLNGDPVAVRANIEINFKLM